MLTVVMKLLQWVRPDFAFFGEKDYQQCQLVQSLVDNFFIPVTIVPCKVFRDSSGLAYSSRHKRLSIEGKRLADQCCQLIHTVNHDNKNKIIGQLKLKNIDVDYIAVKDSYALSAIQVEGVRLIDYFQVGSVLI